MTALDGRPRGAVEHIAREVREKGFIQTTKRGLGASDMTARDGAALVLGLYGASDAVGVAHALASISELPARQPRGDYDKLLPELVPVVQSASALDGIASLIELAPNLRPMPGRKGVGTSTLSPIRATVTLTRPRPQVSIRLAWTSAEKDRTLELDFKHARGPGNGPYEVVTHLRGTIFIELYRTLLPAASGLVSIEIQTARFPPE
jgi:hypothetical protein